MEQPGERWVYNGGASALIGRIIARGTGQSLSEFAREALFTQLGIGPIEWIVDPNGDEFAASGLRITPRDLVRIGAMMLNEGRHEGRQIVPRDWIEASLEPAIAMPDGRRYGYHWYLGRVGMANAAGGVTWERMVFAAGNGGQRLTLVPALDLAVAVTAGNYDTSDGWRPAAIVLRDLILPAFRRGL